MSKYCRFTMPTLPAAVAEQLSPITAETAFTAPVELRDGKYFIVGNPVAQGMGVFTELSIDLPYPLENVRLLPPVTPSKIVCVGRNYRDHAKELGHEVPAEPLIFLKPSSTLIAAGEDIVLPPESSRVDYEGELGVVIGKRCRKLGESEDARPFIGGYVIANDVTARDLQNRDNQWTCAKGFDTFCPCGPLVSNEIDPLAGIEVSTYVNGERRQHGNTKDFLFGIDTVLRYISGIMTLEAGDLILTGTPAGVGPLQAGDVVEVKIDGLGTLRNQVHG